ncbi:uncharacterized protein [Halyomorpha halys]|uniref:uncharacterized protein n=1 Tax=Halyomorpha halys TaxID=286706 RepID=UPI0006D4F561|nr:uncharacterized protein LOC106683612 [Halyomorpha halys]
MPSVSQKFRVPTSRKKFFNNLFFAPEEAIVRSGPFLIPKLDETLFNSTAENSNNLAAGVGLLSKPILSRLSPLAGTTVKAVTIPNLRSRIQLMNHYAPKDIIAQPLEPQITPEEVRNTISFYIKHFNGFKHSDEADSFNTQIKKYKNVDSMYKTLRAQILNYIKYNGIVKREHDMMPENGMKDVGKLDVSFERILDDTEDFLSSMVLNSLNKNVGNFDIDPTASLVEDSEPQPKMAQERSPEVYNETYGDDPEEDSPETQELVESLNQLPLAGDSIYGHSPPPSTGNGETRIHKLTDFNRRYTRDREDRVWAPRKKSNTLLSENLMDKVTELNCDVGELGDQELSDAEVTELVDDATLPTEMNRPAYIMQDLKAVEKPGLDDESLNKRIDQRICIALEIFRNALMCGMTGKESTFDYSSETNRDTSALDMTTVSINGSETAITQEEDTCIDTTCPPTSPKIGSKETNFATVKFAISKKTSTSSSIRKTVKPQTDTKATRDTRKLITTKSYNSKKTTPIKVSNRRNAIKFRMSHKKVKCSVTDHKDNMSDYEKVFGSKHSRLPVSQRVVKLKSTKGIKMSKAGRSKAN